MFSSYNPMNGARVAQPGAVPSSGAQAPAPAGGGSAGAGSPAGLPPLPFPDGMPASQQAPSLNAPQRPIRDALGLGGQDGLFMAYLNAKYPWLNPVALQKNPQQYLSAALHTPDR